MIRKSFSLILNLQKPDLNKSHNFFFANKPKKLLLIFSFSYFSFFPSTSANKNILTKCHNITRGTRCLSLWNLIHKLFLNDNNKLLLYNRNILKQWLLASEFSEFEYSRETRLATFARVIRHSCEFGASGHCLLLTYICPLH